jgi:hypothetical protein
MAVQYVFTKSEILEEILWSKTVMDTFEGYSQNDLEAIWDTDLDGEDVVVVRPRTDPAHRYTPPPAG